MAYEDVQGGEIYLPFARSRLKALRAAGLSHASQKFEIGGVSVHVRIDGQHDYIRLRGSGDLWLLVGAVPYTAEVYTGDYFTSFTGVGHYKRYTKLYRLKPPYNPASATLVYDGSVELTTNVVGVAFNLSGVTMVDLTNSFVTTGAIGALQGFAPYKDKAGMWGMQHEMNIDSTVLGLDADISTHNEHRYSFGWGAHTYTYTATEDETDQYRGATITESVNVIAGDHVQNTPGMLANGQINFKLRTQSGTSHVPVRVDSFAKIALADSAPSVDADGTDAITITVARPGNPYTRREVGNSRQSKSSFFLYSSESGAANDGTFARDYSAALQSVPGATHFAFLNDQMLAGQSATAPLRAKLGLYNYAAAMTKEIDLSLLPGISTDAHFATLFASTFHHGNSADLRGGQFEYATYDPGTTALQRLTATFFNSALGITWQSGPTTSSDLAFVVPMFDQSALWS